MIEDRFVTKFKSQDRTKWLNNIEYYTEGKINFKGNFLPCQFQELNSNAPGALHCLKK